MRNMLCGALVAGGLASAALTLFGLLQRGTWLPFAVLAAFGVMQFGLALAAGIADSE